jgi:hypothetical protein
MKPIYTLLLTILLGSCSVEDTNPEVIKPYFTETTDLTIGESTVEETSANSFIVKIQITSLGKYKSATVGTVLSKTDREPTLTTVNANISKLIITETGTYQVTYSKIPQGIYYVRSYLKNDDKTIYSTSIFRVEFR